MIRLLCLKITARGKEKKNGIYNCKKYCYNFVASFFKSWYTHRPPTSLSVVERKIFEGTATLKDRFVCFGFNLLAGFVSWAVYLLALIILILWTIGSTIF